MTAQLESEAELVAAAQKGSLSAMRLLYEHHVDAVFGFCAARVGRQQAEDVTAETFCRAFEHLPGFEWRGVSARAWLLRIAYHLLVGQSRASASRDLVTDRVPDASADDHADSVLDAMENRALVAVLETLTATARTVLELRYLRDLTVPETAEILGISNDAVRAATYRALNALQAAVQRSPLAAPRGTELTSMHLVLIVESDGDAASIPVVVDADVTSSGDHLIEALCEHLGLKSQHEYDAWLQRSGQPFRSNTVAQLELRDADHVVVARRDEGQPPWTESRIPPEHAEELRPGQWELMVIGGPTAGQRHTLDSPRIELGRDERCDITINGDSVSRIHAAITTTPKGYVIEDLQSTNGTWLEGTRVDSTALVRPGQVIEIGDTLLAIQAVTTGDKGSVQWVDGALVFNRPPRVTRPLEPTTFTVPEPPERPTKSRLPLAASLIPLALGGVMAVVVGNPAFLVFCALSPIIAVVTTISNRRAGARGFRVARSNFESELQRIDQEVEAAHAVSVATRRAASPSPAHLLSRAEGTRVELWERRPTDADFLKLRVGTADLPTELTVKVPNRGDDELRTRATNLVTRYATDPSVPVDVDLKTAGVVGVTGQPDIVQSLARWLVVQAAVLHSPADLAIIGCIPDGLEASWSWLSWLPHTLTIAAGKAQRTVASGAELAELFKSLEDLVSKREGERGGSGASTNKSPRVLVLFAGSVTTGDDAITSDRLAKLLAAGPGVGVSAICVAPTTETLPGECGAIVDTGRHADELALTVVSTGEVTRPVVADGIAYDDAVRTAVALAPVRDSSASRRGGGLPTTVLLDDVLGHPMPTAADIRARWTKPDATLGAPIGLSIGGRTRISLREHGPHAVVAGTTGSGKSELLQSFVLSLAASHSPRRLTFVLVDLKGGAAFEELRALPHTVGYFTDLDEHLSKRALVSLNAEVRRREELLLSAGAGVKDLVTYEERHADAPPSLVIVFDEFAVLKETLPDFIAGIVDIARRGRSLGVHLLLATQSPNGVIDNHIRANANLRIALRTLTVDESQAIIERADAAATGTPPGRAWVVVGRDDPVVTQTAFGGARRTTSGPERPIRVGSFAINGADWSRARDAADDAALMPEAPTDAHRLIVSIQKAAEDGGIERSAGPWLEPLQRFYGLETLLASTPEPAPGTLRTPVGMADDPDRQAQEQLVVDLADDGHLLVYGTSGSGKSTVLRTLAAGLASRYDANQCQIYALDFASRRLGALAALPQVGAVIAASDPERIERLFAHIDSEIVARQDLLGRAGAATLAELRVEDPGAPPHLVILIDGYQAFHAAFEEVNHGELIARLARQAAAGRALGIHFVITADRVRGVGPDLTGVIPERLVLRLADPDEYVVLGIAAAREIRFVPGRAVDTSSREVQLAVSGGDPDRESEALTTLAGLLPSQPAASPVTASPDHVSRAHAGPSRPAAIALGLDALLDEVVTVDLERRPTFVVAGPDTSGRSSTLATLAHGWRSVHADADAYLFAPARSPLRNVSWTEQAITIDDCTKLARALTERLSTDPHRRLLVVIDDGDRLVDPATGAAFDALIRRGRDAELCLLVATANRAATRVFSGWLREVRDHKHGLVLAADPDLDNELFAVKLPRHSRRRFPTGRGYLVARDEIRYVQVADPEIPR